LEKRDHHRNDNYAHGKKSIYIKLEHGYSLRIFNRKFTFLILWHMASKLNQKGTTLVLKEQLSRRVFLRVKLAQVLHVPGVWDVLALGVL
jgi:hypothetical protein